MKLSKLLEKIPDDKIGIQYLTECMTGAKDKARPYKHTEISFVTEELTCNQYMQDTGKIGLVVWIDRDEFTKQMKGIG